MRATRGSLERWETACCRPWAASASGPGRSARARPHARDVVARAARAGNQRRSMRTERSWLPFGSSMVKKRTRGAIAVAELTRSPLRHPRCRRSCLRVDAVITAPRGMPADAEHVAGIGDVRAAHRHVEVPGLLIGQRVHDGIAELEIGMRRDRVQIARPASWRKRLAPALELRAPTRLADRTVEHTRERLELRDGCRSRVRGCLLAAAHRPRPSPATPR